MKTIRITLLLLILSIAVSSEQNSLAVYFTTEKCGDKGEFVVSALTGEMMNALAGVLTNTQNLFLVERSDKYFEAILKEQGLLKTGDFLEQANAVCKAANARFIVSGRMRKVDSGYVINPRLMDSRDLRVIVSRMFFIQAGSPQDISERCAEHARDFAREAVSQMYFNHEALGIVFRGHAWSDIALAKAGDGIASALLPGAGQCVNGEGGKGFLFMVVSGAVITGAVLLDNAYVKDFRRAESAVCEDRIQEYYGRSKSNKFYRDLCISGLAVVYLASVLDAVYKGGIKAELRYGPNGGALTLSHNF